MNRLVSVAAVGVLLLGGGVAWAATSSGATSPGPNLVPWHGVAATSAAQEAAPAITEPESFTVILHSSAFHFTDEDSNGRFSVGDVFSFTEKATRGGSTVGRDEVQCTAAFNQQTLCTGALRLYGRGDLEIAGRVPNSTSFRIALVGGTGAFFNARGQAKLTQLSANATRADIFLVN